MLSFSGIAKLRTVVNYIRSFQISYIFVQNCVILFSIWFWIHPYLQSFSGKEIMIMVFTNLSPTYLSDLIWLHLPIQWVKIKKKSDCFALKYITFCSTMEVYSLYYKLC